MNISRKDIQFNQDMNQQFTFDKKLSEESPHLDKPQSNNEYNEYFNQSLEKKEIRESEKNSLKKYEFLNEDNLSNYLLNNENLNQNKNNENLEQSISNKGEIDDNKELNKKFYENQNEKGKLKELNDYINSNNNSFDREENEVSNKNSNLHYLNNDNIEKANIFNQIIDENKNENNNKKNGNGNDFKNNHSNNININNNIENQNYNNEREKENKFYENLNNNTPHNNLNNCFNKNNDDRFKKKLNERLQNMKNKNKSSSVDTKYKKSNLIGERAQLLQQKIFNNKDNYNNESANIITKKSTSVDKTIDVNELINSKPVANYKKKKTIPTFFENDLK
jgi:hypothetical protein